MSQEIIIRLAELEDANTIVKFNSAMAHETEGLHLATNVVSQGVNTLLQNENLGFYVLAQKNGNVIASLMITYEWSDWRNGVYWWIQSVYVQPDYRRQGVYRRLYKFVQDLAGKSANVVGFRLYVEKENTLAQKTYTRLGMAEAHYLMFEDLRNKT